MSLVGRKMKKRMDGVFVTKAQKMSGYSLSLIIPKEIREKVNLKAGDKIYIVPKETGVFEVHLKMIVDEYLDKNKKVEEVEEVGESKKTPPIDKINVKDEEIKSYKDFVVD